MTSIIWCSWKIRTLICTKQLMLIQKWNVWEQWNALQCIKETEAYTGSTNWTELWHTKPTGFNTSTDCRETAPQALQKLQFPLIKEDIWRDYMTNGAGTDWQRAQFLMILLQKCVLYLMPPYWSVLTSASSAYLGMGVHSISEVGALREWSPVPPVIWMVGRGDQQLHVGSKLHRGPVIFTFQSFILGRDEGFNLWAEKSTHTADQGSSSETFEWVQHHIPRPWGTLMLEIW
jgi:hypothetical protein